MRQLILISICSLQLLGCSVPYLIGNSWHQQRILRARQPIPEVLKKEEISGPIKSKLKLVLQVKAFGEERLGLEPSDNYTTYVDLKRPYVTWVVRAAPEFELEPYTWWFPIVGSVPLQGILHIGRSQVRKREPGSRWTRHLCSRSHRLLHSGLVLRPCAV